MKKILLAITFVLSTLSLSSAQNSYFPPTFGSTWDTLSPQSLGWCPEKIQPLYDYLGSINSKAFIVLKDGKIVIEKYFGTFTKDSLWYWASAGKTLTAYLVGKAQEEGFLSIQDSSSKYLGQGWTSCTPSDEAKITVKNQLSMTTGLNDAVPDPYNTIDTALHCIAQPGTRWAYHNAPYTLLDEVIQSSTGITMNAYLTAKLKQTTGMTGSFYPSGFNNVFVSTARSMARFGLLILNEGVWNGTRLMNDTAYFRQMITTSQNINESYGYLWWLNGKNSFRVPGLQTTFPGPMIPDAPADMISAMGKNGQYLNVVKSMNLVMLRMGNAPGPGEVPFLYNDSIWVRFNDLMCSQSVPVNESAGKQTFRIYPNPASEVLTVSAFSPTKERYDILDITGRVMETVYISSTGNIPLTLLKPGLYIVRNSRGICRRFIKE